MNANIILIITLSVILLISPFLSNILKLPISMIEITLGIIAKSMGLLHNAELFKLLAEVGFLYLMLLAGMEVNLKDLLKLEKSFYKKAFIFFLVLYLLSFLTIIVFHYSYFFLAVFTLVSIGLMLSIQQEVGKNEWLDMAIKLGVLGELISILLLTALSGYFEFGLKKELVFNILILNLVLVFMAVGFVLFRTLLWWYPKLKHYLMPGFDKYFQDVRIAISLFFIMIAVMHILHLDVVLGAFVVGVFLTTFFDHHHNLEHKLAPFGFGFLITVFFVHVGSSIDLKDINLTLLKDTFLITFIMIIMRIIASSVFIKKLGIKNTVMFGLSLSMPLTLLIATATLAYTNHTINAYWYTVLVSAAVMQVLVVMLGVKFINKLKFQKKDS